MNYRRIYDQIIDRARQRELGSYTEKHHIVPRCMGGSNEKDNLVRLTAREHFILHWILHLLHPANRRLAYAFWGMCNQTTSSNNDRSYKISGRAYQAGREAFIQAVSGRECTWGDKISKAKKGVSQGKRSKDSIEKQKQTAKLHPYKHSPQAKIAISQKLSIHTKTKEHRDAISETNKIKGIKPPSQAKPVTIDGRLYSSIKEACEYLNKPRHIVSKLIKKSCK